jgi:hypothetical protein
MTASLFVKVGRPLDVCIVIKDGRKGNPVLCLDVVNPRD